MQLLRCQIKSSNMSEHRAHLRIGVLAIQGAFFEHRAALLKAAKNSSFSKSIDVEVLDVREAHQLSDLDGLILPGGESTTMSLFLQSSNFEDVLKDWVASKERPRVVWGTCAGLILLSNDIEAQKEGGQSKVDINKQGLPCTVLGEWGDGGVCNLSNVGHFTELTDGAIVLGMCSCSGSY